ncbi:hypothetical protein C8F04DRAFT_1131906 [Mycena alexandri]|uniref:Uncharacterized protein n=1 Tax=Mycena alexandri TaxID=1745969 RepID=A0AAD6WUX7_9AGAR|nr:hypothetical protein C8F04DRAFT_1131906 [Mycena alexandri]
MSALLAVFLVVAGLIACTMFIWSPLGAPVRRALRTLWEYMVLSAQVNASDPTLQARRRATQGGRFTQEESWEMSYR